ncbi:Serine/threonine-protein kinase wnk4 [Phytophthora boehmeriae]|uniref:Serine/threonine-protein kinase wnk4 n=1 Tax=Phytophthora boehmeriae TaxID=109152 RepID=A0A8T1WUX9_9STRA|nr:Serine/threonine-protein kinase wnk4 [Phytophthora boehmeriae]
MEENDVYVRQEEGDRPVEHSPRGRYIRFDIRLGTGAYKSVYKAYDTDQGIDVAWNAIDIGLLPSTEKTRIIQEVQLLQKLEHKNIINFYGSWFSKEKNQVVFITEIMTSGTLKSYIKRVQFIKWKIIKRWCIQILEGLHYLHNQSPPVIHRDLKCDNIFVNGNTGDLRIGDLGLSTQLAVDKRAKAQSVLGTPEFMAPELYDESYDEKVDIYAFGMCVLEMVTKEVPYSECINPAQIYKKVTAGIRPKGLQRVVSQAARDFIELCLSRGNGLVDVTAEYLLNHPFLKAQDDDNDMVECLAEDELERESKEEQQRLDKVAEESFAVEFNMASGSKDGAAIDTSERRKDLSLDPEEMSAASSGTGSASAPGSAGSTSAPPPDAQAEEKAPGEQRLIEVPVATPSSDSIAVEPSSSSAPQLTPPREEVPVLVSSDSQPIISEMVSGDEPVSSGKKNADENVDQFLATLPGTESAIQNTRINVMGGRGQRLELEVTPDYADSPVDGPPDHSQSFTGVSPIVQPNEEKVEPIPSPTNSAPGMLTSAESPQVQVPSIDPPERDIEPQANRVRRTSIHALTETGGAVVGAAETENAARTNSQPSPPSAQQASQPVASNTPARKRVKRHEIKAAKDPDNEHSILLNLRIMIDGKSKEIKFPFNLFADSTHEVACELAVDVGILEPDLEDIADSIRFLVTEGKINNLSDVQEDVWEEAPEPHSFSSNPFPNVFKMNFVHVPPTGTYQQQQPYPAGAPGLERAQSASSVPSAGAPHGALQSRASTTGVTGMSSGPSAVPMKSQDLMIPSPPESVNPASLSDPSSTLMVLDSNANLGGNNTSTPAPTLPVHDAGRSPSRPGLPHAGSESAITKETLLNLLEMRARGMSMGSLTDPAFVQQLHNLEDSFARTSFDDSRSSLEAAIRSEEEKHQREIERFRKKMEEFDRQRAAIARQQNGGDGALPADANVSACKVDRLAMCQTQVFVAVVFAAFCIANSLARSVKQTYGIYGAIQSLDTPTTVSVLLQQCYAGFALNGCKDLNASAGFRKDYTFETQFTDPNRMNYPFCLQCCTKPVPRTGADETWNLTCPLNDLQRLSVSKGRRTYRFARRETLADKGIVECPMPTRNLSLYLSGVLNCSVTITEDENPPTTFKEVLHLRSQL